MKQRFLDTGLEHPVGFFSRALAVRSGTTAHTSSRCTRWFVQSSISGCSCWVESFCCELITQPWGSYSTGTCRLHREWRRWILRLSEYVFRIEHKPGVENVIADVLSRLPFASERTDQLKKLRDSAETYTSGELLRKRSNDFKRVNSTQNSSINILPKQSSSMSGRQRSSRSTHERSISLGAQHNGVTLSKSASSDQKVRIWRSQLALRGCCSTTKSARILRTMRKSIQLNSNRTKCKKDGENHSIE